MSWFRPRDLLDQTFEVGIIVKGLDGVLEVIGGLLLLVVSPATIDLWVPRISFVPLTCCFAPVSNVRDDRQPWRR